jgi:DNA-binding NarL/FixJ family response regulator
MRNVVPSTSKICAKFGEEEGAHETMKKTQRRVKGIATDKSRFVVITADFLLGLGIGAMFERMKDFTLSGHASSLQDGVTILDSRGTAGIIVDVRQLPAASGRHALEEFAQTEHGPRPVVVFLPAGSGREAMWVCDRYSVVTSSDPPEEWQAAMWAAWRGGRHLSPPAARFFANATPLAPATNGYLKTLSCREREILALTRAGRMPQEIARELGRSIKTIEAHYSRIKTKLGVERMEALRRA